MNKRKVICLAISSALTLGVCCALAFTMSSRAAKRSVGLADDDYYSLTIDEGTVNGNALIANTDDSSYPIEFTVYRGSNLATAVVDLDSYGYMVNKDTLKGVTRLTAAFTGNLYYSTSVDGINYTERTALVNGGLTEFASKANYVFLETDGGGSAIWSVKYEYTCEAATGGLNNGWYIGADYGNDQVIKTTPNGILFDAGFCHHANFPLMPLASASSNYYVSADVRWDADEADDVKKFIGLVPYYLNDNDFVVAYLHYEAPVGTHTVYAREANIIWLHNGAQMINTLGFDWGDCWSFQNHSFDIANGVNMTVEKKGGAFTLTIGGISETIEFRDFPTEKTVAVGAYLNAADVGVIRAEYSNFQFEENNDFYSYGIVGASPTYSIGPSGAISSGDGGWKNGCVIKDYSSSSYTLSSHIQGTINTDVTGGVMLGFLVWYNDVNNFLFGYAGYESWDRPHEIRSLQLAGKINGTEVALGDKWCDGSATRPADGFDLSISVSITGSGATFNVSLSANAGFTKNESWSSGDVKTPTNRVGVVSGGDSAVFSSFSLN